MEIIKITGYQLEKSLPTSPEDGFVRSEVTFVHEGKEKVFSILYLEFFEQKLDEFSSFTENPVMKVGEKQYNFRDIAALSALLKNSDFRHQRKVYIHDYDQFKSLSKNMDWESIKKVIIKLANGIAFEVDSKFAV